jgi:membrane protein
MAWSFMLALFPSLILLVAGLDLLPLEKRLDSVTSDLISGVSPEVAELLSTFIVDFAHHRPSAGIFLWLIPALWASSRGVRAARQGLQKIYGVAPKGRWLPTRLLDLLWSALALILTGLGFLALILGPQLLEFFGSFLRLETFFSYLSTYFRWPFIFLFLSTISCLAIRILPGAPLTGKAWLSGSALTLGCWLLLGLSFRFWLEHLGHFEKIYGSLASFFILMFLLWLISWTLLLGGLLAANLHPSAASKES